MLELNYVAVLAAAIASMVLGAIWYSPSVFGKKWMELSGMKMDKKPDGMGKMYLMGFVVSLVTAYVLAHFVGGMESLSEALMAGFWIWLGFVATVTMNGVLWGGMKKDLWVLNNGFNLLNLLVMSAVLFYM